ncbi:MULTISPECIES: NDP-hexose 2,3-dehydratase family protein [unclassified Crossiella]|uniref:NDP-hexose 2,3-dehydratase family protein n=1 Tax=unclassified Crossiella TaxID=2620835 RepID=UPI001FFEE0D7|nr:MULTISPECIES: NDP-hexose 2,3-dehydratase family protein [unclassified Crossiella]MCK2241760.1 NDP-hexose 2,3-dehydratase family protein [Crossiella sp. S99.2]MCK2255368.1 NDP-hexose 2,3-dehydratase family protein [Crossiella sp. S99.1]
MSSGTGTPALRKPDQILRHRLARSAGEVAGTASSPADVRDWVFERGLVQTHEAELIAFDELDRWAFNPDTGDLGHDTGRFFSVCGLKVETNSGPIPTWTQPIINQPEIGILGILVKEIDGVLHCLMQAKAEPGNVNGVQLSPTVQATRSNYTKAHGGASVPYLDYFRDFARHRVLADVLQSEQGSWFYRKRNRNMIVEVDEDVEVLDDFAWVTLGQLNQLLAVDDFVNMDARTVLSCMPSGFEGGNDTVGDGLAEAIARSCDPYAGSMFSPAEVLSWITSRHSDTQLSTELVPLRSVEHWRRTSHEIQHESGAYFSVVAVRVKTNSREVSGWTQPLIQPHGLGMVALLVKNVDGVLHALVNARVEPGYLDVVELASTVQCSPDTYTKLGMEHAQPPFLDYVLKADPRRVLFDTVLSEEGGRFYHARNRYVIVEVPPDFGGEELPDYRWLTLHQINGLLQHSRYVNVEARSLFACLRGLR